MVLTCNVEHRVRAVLVALFCIVLSVLGIAAVSIFWADKDLTVAIMVRVPIANFILIIASSIALVYGAFKANHFLLLPWLFLCFIQTVAAVIGSICLLGTDAAYGAILIAFAIFLGFVWVVVFRLYGDIQKPGYGTDTALPQVESPTPVPPPSKGEENVE